MNNETRAFAEYPLGTPERDLYEDAFERARLGNIKNLTFEELCAYAAKGEAEYLAAAREAIRRDRAKDRACRDWR